MKRSKEWHTPLSSKPMTDNYGSGVRNPMAKYKVSMVDFIAPKAKSKKGPINLA